MKCPKCGKEFDDYSKWGPKKFCSRQCANSRVRTDEIKNKISNGVKKHIEKNGTYNWLLSLSEAEKEEYLNKRRLERDQALLEMDFSQVSEFSIKKRIVLEQNGKCNRCGLDSWLEYPISLELEHKDGNNQNNNRENLECLCPNCHSLTNTWRGRNKSGIRKQKVKDIDICRAFLETGNIRQTLLKCGLSAKGANYGRVKRCLTMAGITY